VFLLLSLVAALSSVPPVSVLCAAGVEVSIEAEDAHSTETGGAG